MANYLTMNPNRTDKEERVMLWQNRLMQKVKAFKCDFKVDALMLYGEACVTYRDKEGLEPIISISSHFSRNTSKSGVMAMLHELGHVKDYRKFGSNFNNYILMGNGEVEVRAWENAFELARQLGFKPADYLEMYEYALECLYTYSNGGTDFYNMRDAMIHSPATPMTWEEAQTRMKVVFAGSVKQYHMTLLGL